MPVVIDIKARKALKIVFVILIFAWSAYLLAQKVDLSTADLGRHIKNGELILNGNAETRRAIFTENFYSYTSTKTPFLNHHWGTGVVFYIIHKYIGFTGLHLFFLILMLGALWFSFDAARRASGVFVASAILLFLLPLIAVRSEIRPEAFTYFFSSFFIWVFIRYARNEISQKWLFAIPVISVVWANLHIGFIFGIFIAGVFLLVHRTRPLLLVFVGTILVSLLNPAGLAGLLYPFNIFNGYGYKVLENQSVWFLEKLGLSTGYDSLLFVASVFFSVLCLILCVCKKCSKEILSIGIITLAFMVLSALSVRHFPSFAFTALPFLVSSFALVNNSLDENKKVWAGVFLAILAFFGIFRGVGLLQKRIIPGIGLLNGNIAAGEFLRSQEINGPILNNYDIGGYLIYFLAPETKVFTDNRPEAYPPDFFDSTYIPALEREEEFSKLDAKYNFKTIAFQHRDATPWAQLFLQRIIRDNRFEQAFVDDRIIILIRK